MEWELTACSLSDTAVLSFRDFPSPLLTSQSVQATARRPCCSVLALALKSFLLAMKCCRGVWVVWVGLFVFPLFYSSEVSNLLISSNAFFNSNAVFPSSFLPWVLNLSSIYVFIGI